MSLWDPQQREWLQAMGLAPMALAGSEVVEAEERETGAAPAAEREAPTVPPARGEPAPRREPPPAAPVFEPEAEARTPSGAGEAGDSAAPVDMAARLAALDAARARGGRRNEGPLWEALLRATGQSPALAARRLRELDVDVAALRGDPAGKRALWVKLRRLRAGARG